MTKKRFAIAGVERREALDRARKRWAIMPERDYKRLAAHAGETAGDGPALPAPDARGNYPAVEYARASLARKIIKARRMAGLSQAELARRAAIRPETLNRIEKGKTSPDTATIAKIEHALRTAQAGSE
jgi:ribosome-binding protein aMBF1 (putative translation factor)